METPDKCEECQKPASKRCSACLEGVDANGDRIPPPRYCSTTCQAAHWQKGHKQACKEARDRKQLYQAGEYLQTLFYEWRRAGFDLNIRKCVVEGNKVHIYDGGVPDKIFFAYECDQYLNEENSRAVLSWKMCSDAVGRMWRVMARSLEASIEEVVISPKLERRRVVFHYTGGQNTDAQERVPHAIFRVQYAGQLYAIDLVGAQYDHHRSVTPWSLYVAEVVDSLVGIYELGNAASLFRGMHSEALRPVRGTLTMNYTRQVQISHWVLATAVEQTSEALLRTTNMKLSDMLRTPDAQRLQINCMHVEEIRAILHFIMAESENDGSVAHWILKHANAPGLRLMEPGGLTRSLASMTSKPVGYVETVGALRAEIKAIVDSHRAGSSVAPGLQQYLHNVGLTL